MFKPLARHRDFPTLLVMLTLAGLPAQAHSIKVFAAAQGASIQGRVYFSGGGRAKDVPVTATGPDGQPLGEAKTNDAGEFSLEARTRCDHTFTAVSPDGHRAAYTVRAVELPDDLPAPCPSNEGPGEDHIPPYEPPKASPGGAIKCSPGRSEASPGYEVTLSDPELARLIERAVVKQVTPLREDLQAYQDSIRFRDILGGMGYIAGLAGLLLFFKLRRSAGQK